MKMFKRSTKISAVALMICAFMFSANSFAQKTVKIEGHDNMKFSVEKITAKPGEKITVELTTKSKLPAVAMSHNFVLLDQGVDARDFAMAGSKHKDHDYIDPAKEDEVIAHTDMASGGETVKVTFTAPKKSGDYEYICTFPGHFVSGMKGTLTVQ